MGSLIQSTRPVLWSSAAARGCPSWTNARCTRPSTTVGANVAEVSMLVCRQTSVPVRRSRASMAPLALRKTQPPATIGGADWTTGVSDRQSPGSLSPVSMPIVFSALCRCCPMSDWPYDDHSPPAPGVVQAGRPVTPLAAATGTMPLATSTAASTRRTLSKAVTGVSSSLDAGTRGADAVVCRPAEVDAHVAERQVPPVRRVLDVGVEGAVEPSVDAVLVGERRLRRELEDELAGVGKARAAVGDGAAVDPHDVAGADLHDLHPAPVRISVAFDALGGIAAAVVRRRELGDRRRHRASLDAAGQPLSRLAQLDLVTADHDRAVVTEVLHPVVQPDRHVVQLAAAVGHRASGLTDEPGGRDGCVVLRVVVVLRSSRTLVERAVALVPALE